MSNQTSRLASILERRRVYIAACFGTNGFGTEEYVSRPSFNAVEAREELLIELHNNGAVLEGDVLVGVFQMNMACTPQELCVD